MNNPSRPPAPPRRSPQSPAVPRRSPLFPAVPLLFLLLLSACGRRPAEPTPLPPGTPVIQPTPDFSAPAQAGAPTQTADQNADQNADRTAQSLRTRLAQQRAQTTPTPAVPRSSPAVSRSTPDPSLAVFSRPNALGILSAGGLLYTAPGGGAVRANLQIGATLTITGRSADRAWFAAYLADGTAGWVPANQVRVFGDTAELETVQESLGPAVVATLIAEASKPQTPITLAAASPTPGPPPLTPAVSPAVPPAVPPAVTVIVAAANLRAGPGTDHPVVNVLYQDDTAPLLGRNQNNDWLQIELPTGPAWIFAPLVQTTVPIPDLPQIDPPPDP